MTGSAGLTGRAGLTGNAELSRVTSDPAGPKARVVTVAFREHESASPVVITGLTGAEIDTASLVAGIERPECGGLVVFEGRVRTPSDGHEVAHLEYEAYDELALKQIDAIARDAMMKYDLAGIAAVHRKGVVEVGRTAVVVAAVTTHRAEAFAGTKEVIDRIKHEVAIWKKEVFVDGTSAWSRCP